MAIGGSALFLSFPVLLLAQQVDWTNENHLLLARVAFAVVQVACFLLGKYLQSVWPFAGPLPHPLPRPRSPPDIPVPVFPQAIANRKDERVIYVPPPSVSMFGFSSAGSGPKTYKKTTYYAHEKQKADQMGTSTLTNAVIMAAMSWKFDIHLPLVRSLPRGGVRAPTARIVCACVCVRACVRACVRVRACAMQIMQIVMTPAQMLMDPLVTRYIRGQEAVGLYEESLEL